ncbi:MULTISPECIES: hypothetical protein [Paenibacillus]|uniref:Uncharacterized protein n=1 Tax=Paenibacillus odorifer TaxID=189426 RepID=A0A1R0WTB7_9BACL|nr:MULTISPECIES: hypothetical protein [Paenibacillus]AIQ72601.1 hypothetical protein PODO_04650 [Paenibacillus odorifer]ETT67964.1 hypothetical protein C171_02855 [Paenibacillus sp. FSL H8-237]MEC0134798.1 hypothetical protein [Paenibacillus odorifer]MEC0224269.1 hypothetical protein [Paenibacillus odorifer]OMD01906.1 hypothetical protein BJP46_17615 [Paenibacillus odorifer]
MEWYTFGQMLMAIRMGQKAETPDGRMVMRTSTGLFWINGILKGKVVEIKDYLFSDLWRIYEDEESQQEGIGREQHEQREREMLENQYEELRWANRKR